MWREALGIPHLPKQFLIRKKMTEDKTISQLPSITLPLPTINSIQKYVNFTVFSKLRSKRGQVSKLSLHTPDRGSFNTSNFM